VADKVTFCYFVLYLFDPFTAHCLCDGETFVCGVSVVPGEAWQGVGCAGKPAIVAGTYVEFDLPDNLVLISAFAFFCGVGSFVDLCDLLGCFGQCFLTLG